MANVHPKDPDAQPGGVDDMTKLAYLHEPGVLYNLATRYELNDIYVSFSWGYNTLLHLDLMKLHYDMYKDLFWFVYCFNFDLAVLSRLYIKSIKMFNNHIA